MDVYGVTRRIKMDAYEDEIKLLNKEYEMGCISTAEHNSRLKDIESEDYYG